MSQLRMVWKIPHRTEYKLQEGFRVVNYSDEPLTDGWIEASEELTGGRYSHEQFVKRMLEDPTVSPERIFMTVDEDGKVLSTATAQFNECDENGNVVRASLHMVCSHRDGKGKGAGRAVCTEVMNYMYDHDIKFVMLLTDDFRIPAIKLYLSLGFLPWLYEAGMAERWSKIYETIGYDEDEVFDVNKQTALLKDML